MKKAGNTPFSLFLANMMKNTHPRYEDKMQNKLVACKEFVVAGRKILQCPGEKMQKNAHTKGQWLPVSGRLERTAGFGRGKSRQLKKRAIRLCNAENGNVAGLFTWHSPTAVQLLRCRAPTNGNSFAKYRHSSLTAFNCGGVRLQVNAQYPWEVVAV